MAEHSLLFGPSLIIGRLFVGADQKGYCANQAGLCTEKCPCGCCYKGTHVHFERYGGGETQSLGCWTSVSTSTWVYRWIAPL